VCVCVCVCVQIMVGEVSMYVMRSTREALLVQERTIVTGDCCYLNPLVRRIIRFIGIEGHAQRAHARIHVHLKVLTYRPDQRQHRHRHWHLLGRCASTFTPIPWREWQFSSSKHFGEPNG